MDILIKQDRSIYYWLEDTLPNNVTIVDGFPNGQDLVLPTVSVERMPTRGVPFELGGSDMNNTTWRIDVFAENKAQRDGYAYRIFYEAENNIPVYDYDEGFPPSVSPTQIGVLKCYSREMTPIHVFEELVKKLYWRSAVNFWTRYHAI